ncbi:hypothetical protein HYO65_gp087 [Tenacibaculum phage PTm1]|uniref:Uncharacterized protein n=2 Tax=Shirahamavirus PTm1 TaxID=2846435 RepID=A0A5S9EQN9_9CAUD|nr:hypothetical protein HYO65_gp087 [Tenacibaculum phage PTm1]BBI90479.1 hypothetical protein [Tenacibaculum phage PTm1]BBI90787.1 hypothetical protein [Tenacibaculum phage PTm5]
MSKTKIVVANENTLCYIIPQLPNSLQVLSPSIIRGSTMQDFGSYPIENYEVRLATSKDFETYRVCENGYREDVENYEYNR